MTKLYLTKCKTCGVLGSPRSLEATLELIAQHREEFPSHSNRVHYMSFKTSHPSTFTDLSQKIGTRYNF